MAPDKPPALPSLAPRRELTCSYRQTLCGGSSTCFRAKVRLPRAPRPLATAARLRDSSQELCSSSASSPVTSPGSFRGAGIQIEVQSYGSNHCIIIISSISTRSCSGSSGSRSSRSSGGSSSSSNSGRSSSKNDVVCSVYNIGHLNLVAESCQYVQSMILDLHVFMAKPGGGSAAGSSKRLTRPAYCKPLDPFTA